MEETNLRVRCISCRQETRHQVLREFFQIGSDEDPENWRIVRCAGCESISFLHEISVTDDITSDQVRLFLYPPRLTREPKFFIDAPEKIDMIYRETISAFNSGLFVLGAAGLRALVEGICASEGIIDGPKPDLKSGGYVVRENGDAIRSNNLEAKIEGLAEKGKLTRRHARILHEHRFLGNMAVHELNVPDKEALATAIDIIEHVMEGLYTIPSQGDGLARIIRAKKNQEG